MKTIFRMYGIEGLTLVTFATLIALSDMAVPVTIGKIADIIQYLYEPKVNLSSGITLALIAVISLRPVLILIDDIIRARIIHVKMTSRVRDELFSNLDYLSIRKLSSFVPGELASSITQTAEAIFAVIARGSKAAGYLIAYVSVGGPLLYRSDSTYLVLIGAWFLLYILILYIFFKKMNSTSKALYDAQYKYTGVLVDLISNEILFRVWGNKGKQTLHTRANEHLTFARISQSNAEIVFIFCMAMINTGLIGSFIVQAIGMADQGEIRAYNVMMPITLAWQVTSIAGWLSWELAEIMDSLGSIRKASHPIVLDSKPLTLATDLHEADAIINISDLSFSFTDDDENLLFSNQSLIIRSQGIIGIYGESGAGKSTLVSLIAGMYKPTNGSVQVYGQTPTSFSVTGIGSTVALITQESHLINASIRDNLLVTAPGVSDNQIFQALNSACFSDEICSLIDENGNTGLDYIVGPSGSRLSGGQRQRISIARLFLSSPKIILLDEFDSALDDELALIVWKNIQERFHSSTILLVAHNHRYEQYITIRVSLSDGIIRIDNSHGNLCQ